MGFRNSLETYLTASSMCNLIMSSIKEGSGYQ
jgi:hypothetical protein